MPVKILDNGYQIRNEYLNPTKKNQTIEKFPHNNNTASVSKKGDPIQIITNQYDWPMTKITKIEYI